MTPTGASPSGAWRLSYTPGSWLVLAGPTSVVILQPASPQWSELVANIWEDVLASASIHDLVARMSAFSLDAMPSFGAFFWTPDGMRSLVRGGVVVIDPRSGTTVADGRGVLTWSEVGLGGLEQVRIDLGPRSGEPELVLPLVVGVASAGSVLLDASPGARVSLDQGVSAADPFAPDVTDEFVDEPVSETRAEAAENDADDDAGDDAASDAGDGEVTASDLDEDDDWEDTQFDLPVVPADPSIPLPVTAPGPVGGPAATVVPTPAPTSGPATTPGPDGSTAPAPGAATDEYDDARTVFASSLPGAPGPGTVPPHVPPAPVRPVLAVLRVSTGGRAEVDRPVLIGRSPIASRVKGDQLPRLLTVPSPSHDISRTHLEVAPQDGRVVVTDLNSTNGTVLVRPGSKPVDLEPGTPTPLEAGSLIDLGDGVTIAVDRP